MQIVVLTALNNASDEQMTVRELKAATKMEAAPLCDVVAGLSTAGILVVTEPAADAGIGRCVLSVYLFGKAFCAADSLFVWQELT